MTDVFDAGTRGSRLAQRGSVPTLADARPDHGRRPLPQNSPLAASRVARAKNRGFTLLEMLAVIVLIGIVGTIVVTQVGKNMQKGKYGAGKAQLIMVGQKIQNYALDNGAPPKSLNALVTKPGGDANWLGPYAKPSDLNDPWGHAFGYRYPGQHGMFDLIFYGQDGKPGGEGFNKDVGNWE